MINPNPESSTERSLDYFVERRLKANLKYVQSGDELGIRRAKILSELQAQQWFDLVESTVRRDRRISTSYFKENLERLETGGSDITVWAVESALRHMLQKAVEAVKEWFPEKVR